MKALRRSVGALLAGDLQHQKKRAAFADSNAALVVLMLRRSGRNDVYLHLWTGGSCSFEFVNFILVVESYRKCSAA